jgi:RNA polymerase sigma-70 factor (ECF subfamily)
MEDALDTRALAVQQYVESADARIAEAAKTDPAAFAELYERYYLRVYRYVYHRLASSEDAEDLTGLIFVKALEALPSYQARRKSVAPWLFRIARNAVVDHYRRQRRHCSLDVIEGQAAFDADPVAAVLGTERQTELHRLVELLSVDQRDVLLMRYAADLSFGEIAAAMNKREAAVRMLLHRGLRRLKAVLDDE